MRKLLKWIKNHVRPYSKYHEERGEEINLKKDGFKKTVEKSKDNDRSRS